MFREALRFLLPRAVFEGDLEIDQAAYLTDGLQDRLTTFSDRSVVYAFE